MSRRTFEDADEHAESLQAWDQRYEQLSAGSFAGHLEEAWLGEVQVFRERTNQVVFQAGRSWRGACTLGIVLSAEGEGAFLEQPLPPRSGLIFAAPGEFSLRTPRAFDVVGVAIATDVLRRYEGLTGDGAFASQQDLSASVLRDSEPLSALRSLVLAFFDTLATDPSPFARAEAQKALV